MLVYPVIYTKKGDKKDTYLVYIPDLDGATEGYGLSNAISMARDYIGTTLYAKEDCDFPEASDVGEVCIGDSEFSKLGDSFVSVVDIDIEAYRREYDNRAVRRNVSLPNWLNQKVERAHINVSRVLQEALMEKLSGM